MYATQEECQQKLANTIVFYDNYPVYVTESRGDAGELPRLYFIKLPLINPVKQTKATVKYANDPLFDFRSSGSRLGYINYQSEEDSFRDVSFSWRTGARKVHQGLCGYNVLFSGIKGDEQQGIPSFSLDFSRVTKEKHFVDTLVRSYPSLPETVSLLAKKDTYLAVAFSPQFAIRKDYIGPLYLEYRGKKIGYSDDGNRFKIHEDFKYLNESLIEIPNLKVV